MISCVVVDDEPLARATLRSNILNQGDLRLAGEAGDASDAIDLIEKSNPDLLFLDIQMPELSGFDMLHAIRSHGRQLPETIFVTAFDHYALKAFEVCAVDYLLKPFDRQRFEKAVDNAKRRLAIRAPRANLNRLIDGRVDAKISLRCEGKVVFVRANTIDWVQADGNYVQVHTSSGTLKVRETLSAFEARLAGKSFLRVHRSAIVNLDRVAEVRPWYTGEYIIALESGREVTLSKSFRDVFLETIRK